MSNPASQKVFDDSQCKARRMALGPAAQPFANEDCSSQGIPISEIVCGMATCEYDKELLNFEIAKCNNSKHKKRTTSNQRVVSMSSIISGLIQSFRKNQDYAVRLTHDLTDEQMILQPAGERDMTVNHPAWCLSHLNVYLPVIEGVIQGQAFEDPKGHRYGMESRPLLSAAEYAPLSEIIQAWNAGHDTICALLETQDETVFERPVQMERWATVMPTAGVCLPYLMLNHENIHLGQISAWRRVLGLPSV